MAHKRVRVNSLYYFVPVPLDRFDPPVNVQPHDIVRVVNLPGCPKANTMGMCHVNHTDGSFGGLVTTNSLLTNVEYIEYLRSKIQTMRGHASIIAQGHNANSQKHS